MDHVTSMTMELVTHNVQLHYISHLVYDVLLVIMISTNERFF